MILTPIEKAQYRANLVELHRQLGVYEDFLMRTGFIEPKPDEPDEFEAIRMLMKGIEKRADLLKEPMS